MKAVKSALAMRRRSKLRSAGVASFALFLLLLQPVCAAYEICISAPQVASAATTDSAAHAEDGYGSHGSAPCCSDMRADTMASASPVADDKNFPAAGLIVALTFAFLARPGLALRSHPARDIPPPPPLSYHARSARILR
jgi:hypothetical protein